jgi:4-amino-4-deoxy-L-arabinose transferase-like glycosyltransferase
MSIAVSLVIGVGVGVALDLLSRLRWKKNALVKVAVTWTLALVLLYDAGAYLVYSINEEIYDLPAERVADLQLIRSAQMIPPDGSVIAVGSLGLVEWSPALLEREVLNNPFGLEWIAGREEEMHYLTSQLQSVTDPLDYAPLIRQYFPRTRKVYLVLDNAWISPAVLSGIDAEDLTILAVFDHLTLVSLELHDRSPLTFDSLP